MMGPMTTIHEQEEIEFGYGPRLWDADPDVCCAAFQLGACEHTEAYAEGDNFDPLDDDIDGILDDTIEPGNVPPLAEEPF